MLLIGWLTKSSGTVGIIGVGDALAQSVVLRIVGHGEIRRIAREGGRRLRQASAEGKEVVNGGREWI